MHDPLNVCSMRWLLVCGLVVSKSFVPGCCDTLVCSLASMSMDGPLLVPHVAFAHSEAFLEEEVCGRGENGSRSST